MVASDHLFPLLSVTEKNVKICKCIVSDSHYSVNHKATYAIITTVILKCNKSNRNHPINENQSRGKMLKKNFKIIFTIS